MNTYSTRHLIIIPAYNEEESIQEVVLKAKKYADVCVIDDSSQDRTPEILGHIEGIHVIRHDTNTHIPGALLDGMRYCVDRRYDYAISMDAGLSHNPDEIPLFINCPHSDLLIGVRTHKPGTPFLRRSLSRIANLTYNFCLDFPTSVFRQRYYQDLTSGYRRYSHQAMELLLSREIKSKSFDIMFETAMLVYKNRLKISETPITYNFSNSSLNYKVVGDCVMMCLKSVVRPRN